MPVADGHSDAATPTKLQLERVKSPPNGLSNSANPRVLGPTSPPTIMLPPREIPQEQQQQGTTYLC